MTAYRPEILRLLQSKPDALKHLPEPVRLASGEMSRWFVDAKHAVEDADGLELVGRAMVAAASEAGAAFEAVGGLVLGAVPFTFAVAAVARSKWFLIRKEPKGRGTNLWVEGCRIAPGMAVMLVDDVVTTGGSIQQAYERAVEQGARVVFASTLVDRGDVAGEFFAHRGVPYTPLLSYRDLGMPRVGDEQVAS